MTMITVEDVRELAVSLPRTEEALVRDRVKFRVGRIVYLAFSRDETLMGFAFPKEERDALVASEPEKFMMPERSDLRYNWVVVRLAAIDRVEMREIVLDAWRMVVPKRVAAVHEDNCPHSQRAMSFSPDSRTPGGLPVGAQVIGPLYEDDTAITFGQLLGDVIGGYDPPPV
jgi:hypothetical protein